MYIALFLDTASNSANWVMDDVWLINNAIFLHVNSQNLQKAWIWIGD